MVLKKHILLLLYWYLFYFLFLSLQEVEQAVNNITKSELIDLNDIGQEFQESHKDIEQNCDFEMEAAMLNNEADDAVTSEEKFCINEKTVTGYKRWELQKHNVVFNTYTYYPHIILKKNYKCVYGLSLYNKSSI